MCSEDLDGELLGKIERSMENYRTLIMRSEDGICQIDSGLVIRFANPSMVGMLGCADRNELVGKDFADIVDPGDRSKAVAKLSDRANGMAERYELELRRKDGSAFPASLFAMPLYDEGAFSGSFAVIKDMSGQESLPSRPRTSELRFENLAEQLPAAICELAPDSSIRYLNDSARRLLGLSGKRRSPPSSLRDCIPEYARIRFDRLLVQALAGRAPKTFSMDLAAPSGEPVPALWSMAPIDRRHRDAGVRAVIIELQEVLSSAILYDDGFFTAFGLSDRERAVAKLLLAGMLYKEIGFKLRISLSTVRTHAQSLYRKMGIHSRSELVDIVVRRQAGTCSEDSFMKLLRRALLHPPSIA